MFDLNSHESQGSGDEEESNDGYQPKVDTNRFHQVIREHEKRGVSLGELATGSRQPVVFSPADSRPLALGHLDNNPASLTPFAKAKPTHQMREVPRRTTSDAPSELSTISGDAPSTVVSSEWSQDVCRSAKPLKDVAMAGNSGPTTAHDSAASHPLLTSWRSAALNTGNSGCQSGEGAIQQQEGKEMATPEENDVGVSAVGDGNGLLRREERVELASAGEYEAISKVFFLKR